ncbi:carboxypeptidase regulatory-like domain-containing protein, partial [bacterium]
MGQGKDLTRSRPETRGRSVKLGCFMFRRALPLAIFMSAFPLASYAQPLPDRAPIKGVVVDEAGRPVPSAVLTVRHQLDTAPTAFWGGEVRADASGRFTFLEAEEGSYSLTVDAPQFAPIANFAFDWKAKSAPLRLQLARLGQLTLRILSPDGKPLVQSPVWVRLRDENSQTPARALTNSNGELVIPNVAPSSYSLIVVAQNGISTQGVLSYKSNQSSPIETRLHAGGTLLIKATDAQGKPLGGASLVVFAQAPDDAVRLAGANADPGENWALAASASAPQALVSRDG